MSKTAQFFQTLLAATGSTSQPAYSFIEDPDTGLFRPGVNRLQVVTNGTARWEVDASGHLIPVTDDTYKLGDATHMLSDLFVHMDTFTPGLTATANPTLGSGSSQTGYYMQIGLLVLGFATIKFGTSGTAAGTGNYRVSLPVSADTAFYTSNTMIIGSASSTTAGNGRLGQLRYQSSGTLANIYDSSNAQYSATNPGAWAANDNIMYQFMYRAA